MDSQFITTSAARQSARFAEAVLVAVVVAQVASAVPVAVTSITAVLVLIASRRRRFSR